MNSKSSTGVVCQILFSGLGGHASVAFSLLDALPVSERKKHHLIFFGTEPVKAEYEHRCKKLGISYDAILKDEKIPVKAWQSVIRALKHQRPATIWLHSTNLIFPVKYYARRYGAKLIAVEHTSNQVKRPVEMMCSRFCMRWADKVVALTETYRQELAQILGPKYIDYKTIIIGNGINISEFSPKDFNAMSRKEFKLGMAARFTDIRLQNFLIAAFDQIAHLLPDATLTLAGDGETRKASIEYASKLANANKIHFPGNLNENEIIEFYQSLDLYVHASLGETMSTSLMQAMACGLPILASDIPGINNMIDDGSNGILFANDDLEHLAQQILKISEKPELASSLGKNARAKALADYSNSRMLQQYLDL